MASALVMAWTSHSGMRASEEGNASMRILNEHLGYVTSRTDITVSRALPLAP